MTTLAAFPKAAPMYQSITLPYRRDTEALFLALRDLDGAVWLDSGLQAPQVGRYDIITACPSALIEVSAHGDAFLEFDGSRTSHSGCPLELAQSLMDSLPPAPEDLRRLPFCGGLAGYISYDFGKRLEQVANDNPVVAQLPQLRLGLYHWALIVDHQAQQSQLIFLESCNSDTRQAVLEHLNGDKSDQQSFSLKAPFSPSQTKPDYLKAIDRIHEYIRSGDCYQVNYAQHFSAPCEGDPLSAYLQLRQSLPSPFSAYMDWCNADGRQQAVVSLSPERLLEVNESGRVETKPIKGTIRRGQSEAEDQANARTLLNSGKDRAENLMIVDLLRNDLGKSCHPGSIRVPKLFALESYANVHHLVSTVTGQLDQGSTPLQLLQGCFPGGSITGAPKRRSMEIIEELEHQQRSIYCGTIGYLSHCGRMDTNIAIRTLAFDGDKMHCWGGGGIVDESDANSEYQESLDKVQVLMNTLEAMKGTSK
ncbi:aminodeoxychorismate synthase component I [Porticoccaceae bacterium LTM1]|nr:aminodeoxychorismate synthase component I [Porticoccaceae bacterium LTM1]